MNMNPRRFYMPAYMGMRSIPISNSMLGIANSSPKEIGLFGRITNGIRSVNWSGLLANANKTLNVVNQAIPLVRQAGPMVNNMKSMLRVAKAFGSETTFNNRKIVYNNNQNNIINKNANLNSYIDNDKSDVLEQKKEVQNDNAPNFFI